MNDTETRLRDYLQATAATVPDTPPGFDLETTSTSARRRWPVLLAATTIAVVLVLAGSFLTRLGPTEPDPADMPAPASGPPRVPYTETKNRVSTLYDGDQQVPVKFRTDGYFRGRVGGGWLGLEMPPSRILQVGVLRPNGTFWPVGPPRSESPVASPDGTQIAMVARDADGKGRVLVVDARTRREVASTPVQAGLPPAIGWNKSGIWLSLDAAGSRVWQPGSGEPRPIAVPGYLGAGSITAATDTVVLATRDGQNRCLKAGAVRGTTFEIQREYCDQGPEQLYPVLSPDGRAMIHSVQKVAVDIATGKVTKLQLPERMLDWPEAVFEDGTHVLALSERDGDMGALLRELYRCDVTTGKCTLVKKDASNIYLQQP
ncbi:hypothetical protein [Kribbella sp. CA-247076]|uniref:hypothetical protein n=1 Tax=Kribbella sp. CA-247076 TaxID=3239941 RepID=UPI003D8DCD76